MAMTSPHLPLGRYLLLDHVTRHVGLKQLGLPKINMLETSQWLTSSNSKVQVTIESSMLNLYLLPVYTVQYSTIGDFHYGHKIKFLDPVWSILVSGL